MNEAPFTWEEEQFSVFRALREALGASSVLVQSDFGKPGFLFADASDVAVGAILPIWMTISLITISPTTARCFPRPNKIKSLQKGTV